MKAALSPWRRILTIAAAAMLPWHAGLAEAAGPCFRGINLSGAEFGNPGGEIFKDYAYPSEETIGYFKQKGMNIVRLPFLWERLQPELGQALNDAELQRIKDTVALLRKHEMTAILDPHNYAQYKKTQVGTPPATTLAFADFWTRLASEFANQDDVIFGLMNEPHDIASDKWLSAANAAFRGIRAVGANNLVLVPGTKWTGAHSWQSDGPGGPNGTVMLGVKDPRKNFAYEVHQYFDSDSSGTHDECSGNENARNAIIRMSEWAREHGTRVLLGEFGVSQAPECVAGLKTVLDTMQENGDVWLGWTYWVAGDWWPASEPLNVQPHDGHERKQIAVLESAAKAPSLAEDACRTMGR
ncbi:glycoside hydrolase family 5 protein [Rhizobium yanglingense]